MRKKINFNISWKDFLQNSLSFTWGWKNILSLLHAEQFYGAEQLPLHYRQNCSTKYTESYNFLFHENPE